MKVVLHICCGVCAAGAVERLTSEGHQVQGYFYNPNIHPQEEYQRRLEVARQVSTELGFPLEIGLYTPEIWIAEAGPLADEPEGGERCEICFRLRLDRTYQYMRESGADAFTTTLTISPHKSVEVVNRVGQEIGGKRFLTRDFKKKAGFQRAMELAKKWHLYRQDYCGCIHSLRQKEQY
jgi:predicted adenine nucleotide alpha hydrolase (AANH) superfamily ATPase